MAKPSIFSKDYQKKMRRRKKIVTFTIIVSVAVIIFLGASTRGMFKNLDKDINKIKNVTSNINKNIKDKENAKKQETVSKDTQKSEGYAVQLSDGKSVNAVYEVKNGNKVFKSLSPAESKVFYSISPSGKKMIVYDNKVQGIIFIDINGNKQDISNKQYAASDGTTITRESQLSAQPNYIWCSSPKFIDENNIAYVSQLPWIGKDSKYVWIESISNKNQMLVQGIEGSDVKIGELANNRLTIISDGKTLFLTSDGNVSQ